jgi:hypothetical protein
MKNILASFLVLVFVLMSSGSSAEDFFGIPNYVSKSDRELLKKARKKIMQENPKCVSVDYGSTVSERNKNGNIVQKKGQYFITCDQIKGGGIPPIHKMGFNVFFTKEDILGNKSTKILEAVSEEKSRSICEQAIIKREKILATAQGFTFDESFMKIHTNKSVCSADNYYQIQSGYCTRLFSGENRRAVYQVFLYGLTNYRAQCNILPGGKLGSIDITELEELL